MNKKFKIILLLNLTKISSVFDQRPTHIIGSHHTAMHQHVHFLVGKQIQEIDAAIGSNYFASGNQIIFRTFEIFKKK